MYGDTYGKEVHNWKEYWHDPINGVHEEDWYLEVASEDIEKFIKRQRRKEGVYGKAEKGDRPKAVRESMRPAMHA